MFVSFSAVSFFSLGVLKDLHFFSKYRFSLKCVLDIYFSGLIGRSKVIGVPGD